MSVAAPPPPSVVSGADAAAAPTAPPAAIADVSTASALFPTLTPDAAPRRDPLSSLHALFVRFILAQNALDKERDARFARRSPSINLLTAFPVTTLRVVARLNGFVFVKEALEDILVWDDVLLSAACLVCYLSICFYPSLLLLSPQLAILAIAAYHRLHPSPRDASDATAVELQLSAGALPTDAFTSLPPTAKRRLAKNFAALQSAMALYADLYDAAANVVAAALDPDSAEPAAVAATFGIACGAAVVAVAVVVAGGGLPLGGVAGWLRAVAVVGGVWAFVRGTVVGRAAAGLLAVPRKALDVGLYGLIAAARARSSAATAAAAGPGPLAGDVEIVDAGRGVGDAVAEVFENQRWWIGLGWSPSLLEHERAMWSDASGNRVSAPSTELERPGPPGWEWTDERWSVDSSWADTDLDGWVYSDHRWRNPSNARSLASLTRRRRWVRRMRNAAFASDAAQLEASAPAAAAEFVFSFSGVASAFRKRTAGLMGAVSGASTPFPLQQQQQLDAQTPAAFASSLAEALRSLTAAGAGVGAKQKAE
ncbi:integral peroxisomal membrane peroxin-domain-containing protein [Zopfochytrium polystomum]|nr:integral peroxisomal membrane peroxin-domain-containing protein [Zopfochytrium polystomum]